MKIKCQAKVGRDKALGLPKIKAIPQINLYIEPKLNAQDLRNFNYDIDVISTNL